MYTNHVDASITGHLYLLDQKGCELVLPLDGTDLPSEAATLTGVRLRKEINQEIYHFSGPISI